MGGKKINQQFNINSDDISILNPIRKRPYYGTTPQSVITGQFSRNTDAVVPLKSVFNRFLVDINKSKRKRKNFNNTPTTIEDSSIASLEENHSGM